MKLEGQFIYAVRDNPHIAGQRVVVNPQTREQQQKPTQQYVIVIPPVQHTGTNQKPDRYAKYKRGGSRVLGSLQILVGFMLAGINIGLVYLHFETTELWLIGIGVWGGFIFALAGIFGIAAGVRPTNLRVVMTAALSVLSCGIVIGIAVEGFGGLQYGCPSCNQNKQTTYTILVKLFILVGASEFIFAMAQSMLCFLVLRSKPEVQPDHVVIFDNGGYEPHYNQVQSTPNNTEVPHQLHLVPAGGAAGLTSAGIETGGATGGTPSFVSVPPYNTSIQYGAPHASQNKGLPFQPGSAPGPTSIGTYSLTDGTTGGAPSVVFPSYHTSMQYGESAKPSEEAFQNYTTAQDGTHMAPIGPTMSSSPIASAPPMPEDGPP